MKWSDLEQWIMVLTAIRNIFTIVIQVNVCQKRLKSVFRHVMPKNGVEITLSWLQYFSMLLFTNPIAIMCAMKSLISPKEISFHFVMRFFCHMFKPVNIEAKHRKSVSHVCAIFIMLIIERIPILCHFWKIPCTCLHKLP